MMTNSASRDPTLDFSAIAHKLDVTVPRDKQFVATSS